MKRRIVATMYRGHKQEVRWVRHYNWMDTAMPRALQLALSEGEEGDVVEFASTELGFQIGTMRLLPKGHFEMDVSPLVKSSPSLLKLMDSSLHKK